MNRSIFNLKVLVLALCVIPFVGDSQNLNHWNNFFGSESRLLQGSNIASVSDFGAVYHNPANLMFIKDKTIDVTVNAYRYSTFEAKNKVNSSLFFKNSEFNAIPSLLAGNIGFLCNEKNKVSYSYISKTNENNELVLISDPEEFNLFNDGSGNNDIVTNSVLFHKKFTDDWFGLSWSHQFTDKFNFGISSFVSVLSGYSNSKVVNNILLEKQKLILLSNQYIFNINPVSSINKLGISFAGKKLNLGATITLPSIHLFGKGNFSNELSFVGFSHFDSSANDQFGSNVQKKVNSSYQRPFSAALGLTYSLNKFSFSVTAEYFGKTSESIPLEIVSYNSLSIPNRSLKPELTMAYKPAINYSLGVEYEINKELTGFVGYSKDNNPFANTGIEYEHSQLFNIINSNFDRGSIGFRFAKKSINFILGISYSRSKSTTIPRFDLISESFFDSFEDETTTIIQQQCQAFFGLSLPIGF